MMKFPDLEYLWTSPGYTDAERLSTRLNFYHELGHVLDMGMHTHAYRPKWFAIMHYDDHLTRSQIYELVHDRSPAVWFSAQNGRGRTVIPAEQFAQAYNYCAVPMPYSQMQFAMESVYWGFDYHPSAREQREACRLIGSL